MFSYDDDDGNDNEMMTMLMMITTSITITITIVILERNRTAYYCEQKKDDHKTENIQVNSQRGAELEEMPIARLDIY